MKSNLRFLGKCLLVLLFAAVLLLGFNGLYMQGETYSGSHAGMEKYESVPTGIQFANFGPSYGMNCFQYDPLIEEGKTCFNFALTMQDFYHDYSIYRTYKHHLAENAVVAVPVSYFSFCTDLEKASSARYYEILSPADIKGYSLESHISANYLPIFGNGSSMLRDLVNDSLNAIMAGGVQTEPVPVDASADAKTLKLHNDSRTQAFSIENGNLKVFGHHIPENEDILVAWIEEMRADGMQPVLAVMPFWHEYTAAFDPQLLDECYAQPLARVVEKTGVRCVDFNGPAYDEYIHTPENFSNSDHVSKIGSGEFMRLYVDYLRTAGLA